MFTLLFLDDETAFRFPLLYFGSWCLLVSLLMAPLWLVSEVATTFIKKTRTKLVFLKYSRIILGTMIGLVVVAGILYIAQATIMSYQTFSDLATSTVYLFLFFVLNGFHAYFIGKIFQHTNEEIRRFQSTC